jgi:hypothetical protein
VIIGGARRIYFQRELWRFFRGQVPQHTLGRRTAANVAQANQEYFVTGPGHDGLQQN